MRTPNQTAGNSFARSISLLPKDTGNLNMPVDDHIMLDVILSSWIASSNLPKTLPTPVAAQHSHCKCMIENTKKHPDHPWSSLTQIALGFILHYTRLSICACSSANGRHPQASPMIETLMHMGRVGPFSPLGRACWILFSICYNGNL